MQSCEPRIFLINRFLDGELAPEQEEELKRHLGECPRCAERLHELERTKTLLEGALGAEIVLPDDEVLARRAAESRSSFRIRSRMQGFTKKAAIGAAACFALIIVSALLFAHFYFHKTFSYQLENIVVRCSDGIERSESGSEWEILRVGDRIGKSTLIRTPAGARSFISFDGLRVLADGKAEFETMRGRTLSLKSGEIFVYSSERKRPAVVLAGDGRIQSDEGAFRIARAGDEVFVGLASGTVNLTGTDGETRELATGQTIKFGSGSSDFELASADVEDPFQLLKVSVLDRIKLRFARVISRYLPDYQLTRYETNRFGRAGMSQSLDGSDGGYQFASYSPEPSFVLAKAKAEAISEYYETLFAPSNRSLSIGRQTLVPLEPGFAPVFPKWSHDADMLAYIEYKPNSWPPKTVIKVVRLDDLENPWEISQGHETVLPMLPITWAPDNRHVLFMVCDHINRKGWRGPYTIKIAPIDPDEGPLRDFDSPFHDIPLPLPIPVGKTISPDIYRLSWGDFMFCGNWGNIAYIPVEEDGQSVSGAPGMFITDFNPRDAFVMGGGLSPSGYMAIFSAVTDIRDFNPLQVYILYGVDDILDGFTEPPRSLDDPRIKHIAPIDSAQFSGGFSFDESLTFFHEDLNNAFDTRYPTNIYGSDFDIFYASALAEEQGNPVQLAMPGNQLFLEPSPEGNRIAYCNYVGNRGELRLVSFDIEADMDIYLGGVLIDNSGTNLIVPPGTLEDNFGVVISTPFSIGNEVELEDGEETFFAMRLIDAQGLENPEFMEPMTLTIRYTDGEIEGLDEEDIDVYYYDESDPGYPIWVPLGGTADPEYNEITVEIQHFSKFAVGVRKAE